MVLCILVLVFSACHEGNKTIEPSAQINVPADTVYLPFSGSTTVTVENSSEIVANNITATHLPANVTSSSCSAQPHSSCDITLTSNETAPITTTINIQGNNTNTVSVNLAIRQSIITAPSPIWLSTYGTVEIPVTNTSTTDSAYRVTATDLPPNVTSTECIVLPSSTCGITLTATAATVTSNPIPITITGFNTNSVTSDLNIEQAVITVPDPIYLPTNGYMPVTITNTSTRQQALNVTATNLPAGVTSTACTAQPSATCTMTLTAANAAEATSPVTIQGANTNSLTPNLIVQNPTISISANTLYIPTTGTVSLTITNTDTNFAASNIGVSNLPANVTVTNNNCAPTLQAGSSCAITLTANNAAVGSSTINVAGSNTNTLTPTLSIQPLGLNVSSAAFSTPGSQSVTLTNPSQIAVTLNTISLNHSDYGVSITSDPCTGTTLGASGTCTLTLNATANAYVPSNSSLMLNASGTTQQTGDSVGSASINIALATATINNGNTINITPISGLMQSVPVMVGPGFNWMNRMFTIGNPAKISLSSNCASNIPASQSCAIFLTNSSTLDPQTDDTTLTVTGSNLNPILPIPVNVIGAVSMDAEPLPALNQTSTYYPQTINGSKYTVILVKNTDISESANITNITLGSTSSNFSIVARDSSSVDPSYGTYNQCISNTTTPTSSYQVSTLGANGQQCIVVVKATAGDPSAAPQTNTLTINTNNGIEYDQTFTLTDTTYLYVGGAFKTLGSAATNNTTLLAKCMNGSCSNFFTPSGGTASTAGANGNILTLALDGSGNLYVGGTFSTLGSATAGSNKLLAKCRNNSCINYFNDSTSGANSNINIIAINPNTNVLYTGGTFTALGSASLLQPRKTYLFARCTNTNGTGSCQNFFGAGNTTAGATYSAETATIPEIDSLAIDANGNIYIGRGFTNLGTLSASATIPSDNIFYNKMKLLAQCQDDNGTGTCTNPLSPYYNGANYSGWPAADYLIQGIFVDQNQNFYVTTNGVWLGNGATYIYQGSQYASLFAFCMLTTAPYCDNYFGNYAGVKPNENSVYTLAIDPLNNNHIYIGGTFTQLPEPNSNPPNDDLDFQTALGGPELASCIKSASSTNDGICQNFFGAGNTTNYANGFLRTMVTDGSGNLYVGGDFSSLGSANTNNTSIRLLAKCIYNSTTSVGTCQNIFGSGSTAGATTGGIYKILIGNEMTVTASS